MWWGRGVEDKLRKLPKVPGGTVSRRNTSPSPRTPEERLGIGRKDSFKAFPVTSMNICTATKPSHTGRCGSNATSTSSLSLRQARSPCQSNEGVGSDYD